jgi:hypothetical protein
MNINELCYLNRFSILLLVSNILVIITKFKNLTKNLRFGKSLRYKGQRNLALNVIYLFTVHTALVKKLKKGKMFKNDYRR